MTQEMSSEQTAKEDWYAGGGGGEGGGSQQSPHGRHRVGDPGESCRGYARGTEGTSLGMEVTALFLW